MSFLEAPEVDALIAAPDPTTWIGRRDHAILVVAIQTGLRVSELASVNRADLHLGTGAHLTCRRKGRKHRSTPLTAATVAVLHVWLKEPGGEPDDPALPVTNRRPTQS